MASVWTGSEMLITGGLRDWDKSAPATGAAFDPATNTWHGIADVPFGGGSASDSFWTGSEWILWNDFAGTQWPAAVAYNPARDRWRKIAARPGTAESYFSSVWTGDSVVMVGFEEPVAPGNGAIYDLSTNAWRDIAPPPLSRRSNFPLAWTGREVILWGGGSYLESRDFADGAAYDPSTDSWRMLPPAPIAARHGHYAFWTGSQMLVWGGGGVEKDGNALSAPTDWYGDGAIYDPAADSWTAIPAAPVAPWLPGTAVWANDKLIFWSGQTCRDMDDYPGCDRLYVDEGATYEPATGAWRLMADGPLGSRWGQASVWTGERLIIWGGNGNSGTNKPSLSDGAVYDPATDHWLEFGQ